MTEHGRHRDSVERLHRERWERTHGVPDPDLNGDTAIASAWHALQLHWLRTVPGYRAEVRLRVAEAAIAAERRAKQIEARDASFHADVDTLGREIDGCG